MSISTLALTIRRSLPISTLVMSSQFRTIFRSDDNMKSVWFLVAPPGASHVQYLFAAFKKNGFVTTRLFSSAKSRSLSPLSFLLPVPKFACLGLFLCTLIRYIGFTGILFMLSWMFQHDYWTPTVLSVLYACVLYFCIWTCSAQLSMFHMERRSRNTLIIINIIIHWPVKVHKVRADLRASALPNFRPVAMSALLASTLSVYFP